MKNKILFICCIILLICMCASQQEQKTRDILPEFKTYFNQMPEPLRIVKKTYPDALVIRELPNIYYYVVIIENNDLKIVTVDKKSKKVLNKYKVDIIK